MKLNCQMEFKPIIVELKGQQNYFVEGYISTTDIDDYGDVVTPSAQESILRQVQNKTITMDIEHEEWLDEQGNILEKPKGEKIPVAKIVEAELRAKGVWVKAEINKDSERFKNIWGSIKNKFLHSFSIGYYPLKAIVKEVNGVLTRFLDDLTLVNVTLTGAPVNTNATFAPVMKAYLTNLKTNNEVINMTEEPKPAEQVAVPTPPPAEEKPAEEKPAEEKPAEEKPAEEKSEALKILEEEKTKLQEENKKLQEQLDSIAAKAKESEEALKTAEEVKTPLGEIKSLREENSKLKAQLEKPIFKSKIESAENVTKALEEKTKTVLDLIR